MSKETVPHRPTLQALRGVEVEVVRGPDSGASHAAADSDTISVGTADGNDLVLADGTVSRYHAELRATGEGIQVTDHGSTNGTQVGGVRLERGVVPSGTILTLGRTQVRVMSGEAFSPEVIEGDRLGDARGRSGAMRKLMARLERAARSDVSILLIGETGVGKEVLSRAVHQASPRAGGPIETVDCGALSPTLIASELFGHEKGAFTGATERHIGAFERASGGTLFLDEVGELPSALQPNLLGALERRSFRRLGGRDPISVDVRVVCATNRDLRREVNEGRFRQDLYYRIAVLTMAIPPLRERPDDIPLLIEHFLGEMGVRSPVEAIVPADVMDMLSRHRWPGNARELRNFVEAAVAMGEPPDLEPTLPPDGEAAPSPPASRFPSVPLESLYALPFKDARAKVVHDFEARYLEVLMAQTRENVSAAARRSEIHRSFLTSMLKRHGLR